MNISGCVEEINRYRFCMLLSVQAKRAPVIKKRPFFEILGADRDRRRSQNETNRLKVLLRSKRMLHHTKPSHILKHIAGLTLGSQEGNGLWDFLPYVQAI